MKELSFHQIVRTFLNYFEKHERWPHKKFPEVPLIPKLYDPSTLFISAGMHPLKPYFLGLEKPPAKRLCSIQRCFRTTDIDEVGIKDPKLTLFFMLGNWSFGDYWKAEAIEMAYDLLVNKLKLQKERLWFSIFEGNQEIPKDEEAKQAWLKQGIEPERIVELGLEDNFWSSGPEGPCGPCSEIYWDLTQKACEKGKQCMPGCDCGRWTELWNLVFIQYNRTNSSFQRLPFNSVDTGAGLERLALVLQGKASIYETDLFEPIVKAIESITGLSWKSATQAEKKSIAIAADHLRAATFILADGVKPAKIERGYVLRRLIRRAIRHLRLIKLDAASSDVLNLVNAIIESYSHYKHLKECRKELLSVLEAETKKFLSTLNLGLKQFYRVASAVKAEGKAIIPGIEAFHLYDTYGFPLELTKELAAEQALSIDEKGFEEAFAKHRELSRTEAAKEFKSGLVEITPETIKLHTATHLLHQALRDVLGPHVQQKGSNITKERLRFDFSHDKKLTSDEIKKVEAIVNEKIKAGLPVIKAELSLEEAKAQGYLAFFELKYRPEKVSVYKIGDYSKEVCAGPHVKNTKELGKFKIISEKAIGTGIRRIKAVLE